MGLAWYVHAAGRIEEARAPGVRVYRKDVWAEQSIDITGHTCLCEYIRASCRDQVEHAWRPAAAADETIEGARCAYALRGTTDALVYRALHAWMGKLNKYMCTYKKTYHIELRR